MPRNGSGVYSKPAGTTAAANTTIESAKYNSTIDDLVVDANAARPIVAGGTGATSAGAARTALAVPGLAGANTFTGIQKWAKGVDVASATALTLGDDGNYFDITGTTTITAIATKGAGTVVKLHFDASLTLTHNATDLILPGGANIITAAGDEAEFVEYATGDWRCTNYTRASENWVDVASATTTDIGAAASQNVRITGTTTITGFGTVAAGTFRRVRFAGALTLTHNGTILILPGPANITTAAGDVGEFISEGSGNWRCVDYTKASGQAVISGGWEMIGQPRVLAGDTSIIWTGLSAFRSLECRGFILPSIDGVNLRFRTSTNNGSSYDSGASDYTAQRLYQSVGTVNGQSLTTDRLPIQMGVSVGNAAAEGCKFHAEFEEFNQAAHLRYTCHAFYLDAAGAYMQEHVMAKREQATARDALELSPVSGNLASGRVTLWGLR